MQLLFLLNLVLLLGLYRPESLDFIFLRNNITVIIVKINMIEKISNDSEESISECSSNSEDV